MLTRGLFLMLLELTLVGFAWSAQFPPQTIWFAGDLGHRRVHDRDGRADPSAARHGGGDRPGDGGGHNLLDPISFSPDSPWFKPGALIHKRSAFEWMGITVKTTYPVLPWIGVIALG